MIDLTDAQKVAHTANAALRDNPHLKGSIDPLRADMAVEWVAGLQAEGIPLATILRVVREVAGRFKPKGDSRRIAGFNYFTGAVRKAHQETQPDPMAAVIQAMQAEHESKYGKGEAA